MRTSGVTDVIGLPSNDHLCWPFDGFAEFRARAAEFLADGLALGRRALPLACSVSLLGLKDVECVR